MSCNSANAKSLGMKADRIALSGVSSSGNTITSGSSVFLATDVGKTLVIYDAVWIDWSVYFSISGTVSDTTGLPYAGSGNNGQVYRVGSGPEYAFYRSNGTVWIPLKYREARASVITAYTNATTVTVDYSYDTLTGLTAVFGTDNFYSFQQAVDHCLDNGIDLCIPDGDYLVVFNDDYTDIGEDATKQGIRLFSGTESSIQLKGESKLNTRLFFELEAEIMKPVQGLMVFNNNDPGVNNYAVIIESLQINGPDYKPKIIDLTDVIAGSYFPKGAPNFSACYTYGPDNVFELNEVIIEGNRGICAGVTLTGGRRSWLKTSDLVINNCTTIGIGLYGDRKVLEMNHSTITRVGYDNQDTYTGRDFGSGIYLHSGGSYSIRNCTFENIPRHFMGSTRSSIPSYYYYPENPILFQELINCKVINSGSMNTDETYPLTVISGCMFDNIAGIGISNNCIIQNCTFTYAASILEPNTTATFTNASTSVTIPTVPGGSPVVNSSILAESIPYGALITAVSAPTPPLPTPPPPLTATTLTINLASSAAQTDTPATIAFLGGPSTMLGIADIEYPANTNFEVNISDCVFYRLPVTSMADFDVEGGGTSSFHFKFNNCRFESTSDNGSLFQAYGHNRLSIINSNFVGGSHNLLTLYEESSCVFEGNVLDDYADFTRVFLLTGDENQLKLTGNYIPQTVSKIIELGGTTFTKGGQITGSDNYIALKLSGFANNPAFDDGFTQNLFGARANYPDIITFDGAVLNNVTIDEVDFNHDFYKIQRDGFNAGSPLNITGIAYTTSNSLKDTNRAIFTGSIRIMPVHDPLTQGDIVLQNSGGVMANGNIMLKPFLFPNGTLNSNTTITGVSSTVGIVIGMPISGTGIPASTTVTAFTVNTITISNAATISGPVNLTIDTGGDYTVAPYEVLEFYYDTPKQMWYLAK